VQQSVAALQQLDTPLPSTTTAQLLEERNVAPDALRPWLELLDDRATHAAWWVPPPQVGLQQLWAIRVRSPEEALELAEITLGAEATGRDEETHRGRRFVKLASGNQSLCLATLDRYLVIASSPEAMHRAIEAAQDPAARLAEQFEYRLVASRAQRLAKGRAAGLQFVRPVDYLRHLHTVISSEEFRESLRWEARAIPWLVPLQRSLAAAPLPDFSLIDKHAAPGGSVVYETSDAVVHEAFLLRRK
jgi:hypothetical protein